MSLNAQNITVSFGALVALKDIELKLDQGEILGLIGPNGAGKTTLVNIMSGFQKPTNGNVVFDTQSIGAMTPQQRSILGVVRTFQGARIFSSMTALENVQVGAFAQGLKGEKATKKAKEALEWFDLGAFANTPANQLTYGQERELDLARALCTEPKYLLLDEPAAGMNENETASLKRAVRRIRDETGIGVLLIEHDMSLVMTVCDRVHVLAKGETLAIGTPAEVQSNHDVLASYLGTSSEVTQ